MPLIDECIIQEYSYASELLMTDCLRHIKNGSSLKNDDIHKAKRHWMWNILTSSFSSVGEAMVLCASPAAVMTGTCYKLFLIYSKF